MKSLVPLLFFAHVDPHYRFDEDRYSDGDRKYVYEFCKEPVCDGALISKTMLEQVVNVRSDGKGHFKIYKKGNSGICYNTIREFLSLYKSPSYKTFADPGTWSYVHKLELPDFLYDQEFMFNYYNSLRFDLCGSVDWPVVDKIRVKDENGKVTFRELSYKEKNHRVNLTVELAGSFMKRCSSEDKINFVPFGTVQGYNVRTYIDSLKKILKLGYEYVAIGGLPSYSEKKVLELLGPIRNCIRKYGNGNVGLHLYGRFPSPKAVKPFSKAGVTSFDNNSSYISSTQSSCNSWNSDYITNPNLITPNFPCYSLKIPSTRGNIFRSFKKEASEKLVNIVIDTADRCYNRFVRFNKKHSKKNIKKFMKSYEKMYFYFKKYNVSKITDNKIEKILCIGRKSLEDKSWEKCGCTLCKKAGAHIVLIRGEPRLRYTFLHNTYVQYSRYLKELENPTVKKYIEKYDWTDVYAKGDKNIKAMEKEKR